MVARKTWCGAPKEKDDFGAPITNEFVDGATRLGPWAIMNPDSFRLYGLGLGTGIGQRYVREADDIFYKVGG